MVSLVGGHPEELVYVECARRNIRTRVVDALGRLISNVDTAGNSVAAEYPDFLTQELQVRGSEGSDIAIERTFTLLGSLSSQTIAGTQIDVNRYDAAGRLTSTENESGVTVVDYDGFSQPARVARGPKGTNAELSFQRFTYDDRGRLLAAFAGERQVAAYAYDLLGRPVRESRISTSDHGSLTVNRTTRYVGASRLPESLLLPSGRQLSITYVPDLRLVDTITVDATGAESISGPAILTADFDYSAHGRWRVARC